MTAGCDSVYLDIFSLGAIAYLLFTGQPPAANDLELQDKLSRGSGLQITDALNGACRELQDLIQYATHPDTGCRIGSVAEFIQFLYAAEGTLAQRLRSLGPIQLELLERFGEDLLDTLGRLNINNVESLLRLPRNELVRMTGVGTQTRRELSELIAQLQARLGSKPAAVPPIGGDGLQVSVDQLFRIILPKPTKATDPARQRFLNEYLGRLDSEASQPSHHLHWPTLINLSAELGMPSEQARVVANWAKNKFITQLRRDIDTQLLDHGCVMTAAELAEAVLLRRGSVQPSPLRERWARAVVRAAVETELARQEARRILRRCGKRILLADNGADQGADRGQALADYAEALGQLADDCAEQQPLLSPPRALERSRAVPAPESFAGLSNHRLLRLAVAASQCAALSSRAEFYPRGMSAERSIELAQGALLGTAVLSVAEVQDRIQGRYPEAQPLPGRPQLDSLMQRLELGFVWDAKVEYGGKRGAYCLPRAGQLGSTAYASTSLSRHLTAHDAGDLSVDRDRDRDRDREQFARTVQSAIDSARFLALSVRPGQWQQAQQRLRDAFALHSVSFDALLLRHLHQLCDGMARPPDWQVVLLTDTGLIARYGLIDSWLADLRQRLQDGRRNQALLLLIANDTTTTSGAVIDGHSLPSGAGSKEYARIPSAWLHTAETAGPGAEGAPPW